MSESKTTKLFFDKRLWLSSGKSGNGNKDFCKWQDLKTETSHGIIGVGRRGQGSPKLMKVLGYKTSRKQWFPEPGWYPGTIRLGLLSPAVDAAHHWPLHRSPAAASRTVAASLVQASTVSCYVTNYFTLLASLRVTTARCTLIHRVITWANNVRWRKQPFFVSNFCVKSLT